jgi:hypothetical protein
VWLSQQPAKVGPVAIFFDFENLVEKTHSSGTKMYKKVEKVFVIGVMTDRTGLERGKSVRHKGHDGQKWM